MTHSQDDGHEPTEQLIALREVPLHLPRRRGKKVHYSTIFRWATKGAHGRILESKLIGGVRYTTRAALHRFLQGDARPSDQRPVTEQLRQALYGKTRR